MKGQILTVLLISTFVGAHAQKQSTDFFDRLTNDAIILTENGLVRGEKEINIYITDFAKSNGSLSAYKEGFNKEVNAQLDYEIGIIETDKGPFSVMFLKQQGSDSEQDIEFLVIYRNSEVATSNAEIDQARTEWMQLCNAHQAEELVKQLYTSNAYYYNRGRLLQGTQAITQEYSYMNRAGYSLKLTPLHVVFVTPTVAYEIGQCSGSYPLPYMLLWTKQADGNWKVLIDSNF